MKNSEQENESRLRTKATPIGEKNVCLRMLNQLLRKESTISDGECFLVEMLRQSHRSLGSITYVLSTGLAFGNRG